MDTPATSSHTLRNFLLGIALLVVLPLLYVLSPGPVARIFDTPRNPPPGTVNLLALEECAGGIYRPLAKFDQWFPDWYWGYNNWWLRDSHIWLMRRPLYDTY
jgi:hypothetical protein